MNSDKVTPCLKRFIFLIGIHMITLLGNLIVNMHTFEGCVTQMPNSILAKNKPI